MLTDQDYVLAENVRLIGEGKLAASLQGVFLGTQNYFFFIPVNTSDDIRHTKRGKTVEPTFFIKGKPANEVLKEQLNRKGISQYELEDFIFKKVKKAIPETIIYQIDELGQFKVYTKWWGSGILINTTDGKTGWKSLVSRFKQNKQKIKKFYQGHSKLIS